MFLIGLGFTPRMTYCKWLLYAIINTNIAQSAGHTNSLQKMKPKKCLIWGYDIPKLFMTVFCRKRKASLNPT